MLGWSSFFSTAISRTTSLGAPLPPVDIALDSRVIGASEVAVLADRRFSICTVPGFEVSSVQRACRSACPGVQLVQERHGHVGNSE